MKGSSTTVGSIVEGQRYLLLLLLLLMSPYSSKAKEKASDSADRHDCPADRHGCPPDISLGKLDRVNAEAP